MSFTDPVFLCYFFPGSILLHALLVRHHPARYPRRAQLFFVLLTVIFYASGQPWWLVPLAVSALGDFLAARVLVRLDPLRHARGRRAIVFFSVLQNLALLATFKYPGAIAEWLAKYAPAWGSALPAWRVDGEIPVSPAGISFYTFESLSFVIDVYRRKFSPPRDPLGFLSFLGMYPRFVAGPIVRYGEIAPQFAAYAGPRIEQGLATFFYGLALKCLLADSLATLVPYAFRSPATASLPGAWLGLAAFTGELYLDFQSYSLMAIGAGRCFGFEFPANFRTPYLAESLRDFWGRWHISLSRWLKDYLYLPLGGNRHSRARTYVNLWLTFLLGGLWHGPKVTFLAWGAWHGTFLVLERWTKWPERLPRPLRRMATLTIFSLSLVFFRAESWDDSLQLFARLAHVGGGTFNPALLYAHPFSVAGSVAAGFFIFWAEPRDFVAEVGRKFSAGGRALAAAAAIVLAFVASLSGGWIPFIYFQF